MPGMNNDNPFKGKTQLDTREKSSSSEIAQFLKRVDQLPQTQVQSKGRLLFAIDATASRQPTWDTACHIQSGMFSSTQSLGGIQTQLCYYKGFREFFASPWISSTTQLQSLMSSVGCAAGHTQIYRVLEHGLKEHNKQAINALVFIGDTIEESADTLCELAGQFGLRKIPLFIFHETLQGTNSHPFSMPTPSHLSDREVKQIFQQMAKLSGGAYCPFNLNSAETLSKLLNAVAVYASGGKKALTALQKQSPREVLVLLEQLK